MADMQARHDKERNQYETQLHQVQKQSQNSIDHLQRKCQCLTKLFEEVRMRYERRESRQEDLNIISDLRQVIAEQEKDLTCINEEKRYYQMKLMSIQRSVDEEDEDFVDTEEFEVAESAKHRDGQVHGGAAANFPNGFSHAQSPNQPQPHNSLSIPPTIPECDDYDD